LPLVAGGRIGSAASCFRGHAYFVNFLLQQFKARNTDPGLASLEYALLGVTTLGILIIYFITRKLFAVNQFDGSFHGLRRIAANKFYVDEIYNAIVVRPINLLGKKVLGFFEIEVIDWIVNGTGRIINYGSRQVRLCRAGR
jgi:NADH-quinone oxidoreductase subunit L